MIAALGFSGEPDVVPTLTVARVALANLSLSGTTVVGGVSLTGTVTLTAPAPTGGAASR